MNRYYYLILVIAMASQCFGAATSSLSSQPSSRRPGVTEHFESISSIAGAERGSSTSMSSSQVVATSSSIKPKITAETFNHNDLFVLPIEAQQNVIMFLLGKDAIPERTDETTSLTIPDSYRAFAGDHRFTLQVVDNIHLYAAISGDGHTVVYAFGRFIKIDKENFDTRSYRTETLDMNVDRDLITSVAINNNGQIICVGTFAGLMRIYRYNTAAHRWDTVHTSIHGARILGVGMSEDGKVILVCSDNKIYSHQWNSDDNSWKQSSLIECDDIMSSGALSGNGQVAAFGLHDGRILIYRWHADKIVWELERTISYKGTPYSISLNRSGKKMAVTSAGKIVTLYDISSKDDKQFNTFKLPGMNSNKINSVALSVYGKKLALARDHDEEVVQLNMLDHKSGPSWFGDRDSKGSYVGGIALNAYGNVGVSRHDTYVHLFHIGVSDDILRKAIPIIAHSVELALLLYALSRAYTVNPGSWIVLNPNRQTKLSATLQVQEYINLLKTLPQEVLSVLQQRYKIIIIPCKGIKVPYKAMALPKDAKKQIAKAASLASSSSSTGSSRANISTSSGVTESQMKHRIVNTVLQKMMAKTWS